MEYIPLADIPYYRDCAEPVNALGYELVDLKVVQSRGNTHIAAVICGKTAGGAIGSDDCAKVHRLLRARFEALLGNPDISMEVASPGMERTLKNAAEFALFRGCFVRVWDKTVSDWVPGKIVDSDAETLTLAPISASENETENNTVTKKEADTAHSVVITYANIAKAKLLNR